MNGIMIEAKPLTAQQAAALIHMVNETTVKGAAAGDVLEILLSLKRLADGTDEAAPVRREADQK